jgi:hypothetical protein
MTEQTPPANRTVFSLSLGSRICLLLGALLVLFSAYLFWSPIGASVPGGFPAKCGTAADPPSDSLGKAVCGSANAQRQTQSLAVLGAAIVVVIGGLMAFGVTQVVSQHDRRV